jgi:DNA-binding response OmpR family regulator
MLTGKGDTVDKVIGLELGADDYLAKPFDLRELLARLRSIQRRSERTPVQDEPAEDAVTFSGWVLDLASQQLKTEADKVMHLTQAEYRILVLLVRNPRKAVTRDQLMATAAGRDWAPLDRSIDVHISNLRRKLDPDPNQPSLIRTVRGSGYMFVPNRG